MLDSKADLRAVAWDVILKRASVPKDDLDKRTLSIRVTMHEHGQADEFELSLKNDDGYFSDPDLFEFGDRVELFVWFADRARVRLGEFSLDEISDDSAPNTVSVTGLSADTVRQDLRTLKSRAFEGLSLKKIVSQVAGEHGLTLDFKGPDVKILRSDQKEEHDLQYLTRIADQYGYIVRISGDTLIFWARDEAEKGDPLSLDGLVSRRSFRAKTFETYKRVKVRYYDPQDKTYREQEIEDPAIQNDQELKETIRAESLEQARIMAKAALKKANKDKNTCEIECLGVPELQPGINVDIRNEGIRWNGIWHVEQTAHNYSKGQGYTVCVSGYKI